MKFSDILLAILHAQAIITQLRLRVKDDDLIETTCRKTSNYRLCVSTLRADPCSATADVPGLGLIMVDAVRAKAETALSAISEQWLLHPEQRQALEHCTAAYEAVLKADVPEAVVGLRKGVPKFAEFGMSDAAWEAEICQGNFEKWMESPLSQVNQDLRELALVATAIIRELL
ncbi:cell wall / vacuolar inhibitor of fructosidase 1 [Andrographis paniculata]|uniref:cell wall / vacuolar inhibitor of fructosidase 1 n=1 Tax=Andrographis paniculata TaxID=175694 RepID=UPI0021E8097D|nr:cell wall / vacuolar inhibitor of fructosidase 1 [Andrographis paniculata]